MDHCNIQASEIIYRFDSGEVFKVTRTHPEPQEVHTEDRLTRHLSRLSIDAVDGEHCHILPRSAFDGDQACSHARRF